MQRKKIPLLVGFTCYGMQIAINSNSCCQSILVHTLADSIAVDNMVLAHSNVALAGSMDRSKNHDRSSS